MPDKGAALNERVWKLFEKAGFQTKPNSGNPAEEVVHLSPRKIRTVDLLATDRNLDVKIIGWNKARKELKEAFSVHVNDYETIKGITRADTVLFVSTEAEISDDDKEYAEQHGMMVWREEELRYYEALVDTIGGYAKYEIINSLGVRTNEETSICNVLALKFCQPFFDAGTDMFLFTINPEKLLKMCAVLRKARGNRNAYQRILQKKRLRKIKEFVTRENALLPPNIIVHLSDNVRWEPIPIPERFPGGLRISLARPGNCELGVLGIPTEYASLELIDGQHRLYGFVDADPATKEHFNLVVLGMMNVPPEKRTDTFVAINDNARRMDANLVAYLKLTEDDAVCQRDNELMAIRVVVELNRTTPFRKKVRLLDVGNERITLKGFAGYDLKGLLGERGLLRKHYVNEPGAYVGALRLYFGMLKSMFPEQWNHPEKYIIFTNIGISAFLKLLRSILKTHEAPLDNNAVRQYLQPLRDKWVDRHWETKRLQNAYVGSKGWKDFHKDLVAVIKRTYPEFKE